MKTLKDFEVGDLVFRNDGFKEMIKVYHVGNNVYKCVRFVDNEPRYSSFQIHEIRHVTDEEIKANMRLDKL